MIKCLFVLLLGSALSANTKGVLTLDSWTFDKIVDGSRNVLVKFDKEYAYGTPEDEFKEFAKRVGEMEKSKHDLLVAEVGKTDYGEKKNSDLHERFDIQSDDFPVFKLFKKGSTEPITFSDTVDVANLSLFAKLQAGVFVGVPGCLEKFDNIVEVFMSQKSDKKSREKLLSRAVTLQQQQSEDSVDSAKAYVRTMKKIIENGDAFVDTEISRVKKLKDAKLSDKKKAFFERRLNVLSSFKAFAENNKAEIKKEL